MQTDYLLFDRGFRDLNPVQAGEQFCPPGHRFGPAVRDCYLIHYVFSGKGTFCVGGQTYPLSAGGFFLIRPGEITVYEADAADPWHYAWIGFTGTLAARFDALPSPVGVLPPALFGEFVSTAGRGFPGWENMQEAYIVTVLHRLTAALFAAPPAHAHYARRAEAYIRAMYMQDISVDGIAAVLSLDRRYLGRLFKAQYGVSLQEYLISVRMEAAARFLLDGRTVGESARLCGYHDPLNFSRMFRRRFGVSPRRYVCEQNSPDKPREESEETL